MDEEIESVIGKMEKAEKPLTTRDLSLLALYVALLAQVNTVGAISELGQANLLDSEMVFRLTNITVGSLLKELLPQETIGRLASLAEEIDLAQDKLIIKWMPHSRNAEG